MPQGPLLQIRLVAIARSPAGRLVAGGMTLRCALGRSGVGRAKREGDGRTPAALLRPVAVYYRPDRLARPRSLLPVAPLSPDDGWCDDPADRAYNRPVRLPYPGRHERLWREDRLYDLIVVLDWNLDHPRRGRGSAIFLHGAAPGLQPTEGCIALVPADLRRLLPRLAPGTGIAVGWPFPR